MLEESLRAYGAGRSILIDKHGRIIAGNKTAETAQAIGLENVIVVPTDGNTIVAVQRTDLDLEKDARAKELALADNRVGQVSLDWDPAILAELSADIDLSKFWLPEELAELLADGDGAPAQAPEAQVDKADELRDKWQTARGQIWEIGKHRLMCGDSMSAVDVGILMDGKHAALCLTDPPYGIGEDYASHDDTQSNLSKLVAGFFPLARKSADVVLLTPGNSNQRHYPSPDWTLAWFVPAGTGRSCWGFSCWQPVLAYGKDPYLATGQGARPDALVKTESADNSLGHPCPKPLGVWTWLLERGSTAKGDIVYEPFSGSGTTLIACHGTARLCYGMEIEPKYVAVALERMAQMGLAPRLVNG